MARPRWNLFGTVIIDSNQMGPPHFPVVSDGTLLFDNSEVICLKEANEFGKFHVMVPTGIRNSLASSCVPLLSVVVFVVVVKFVFPLNRQRLS